MTIREIINSLVEEKNQLEKENKSLKEENEKLYAEIQFLREAFPVVEPSVNENEMDGQMDETVNTEEMVGDDIFEKPKKSKKKKVEPVEEPINND